MEMFADMFMELFGEWFSKTILRVFLGAIVFFLPFLLIAICLWTSESNLWIFASTIASKVLAVVVLLFSLDMAFGVLWALGELNSWNRIVGDVDRPR